MPNYSSKDPNSGQVFGDMLDSPANLGGIFLDGNGSWYLKDAQARPFGPPLYTYRAAAAAPSFTYMDGSTGATTGAMTTSASNPIVSLLSQVGALNSVLDPRIRANQAYEFTTSSSITGKAFAANAALRNNLVVEFCTDAAICVVREVLQTTGGARYLVDLGDGNGMRPISSTSNGLTTIYQGTGTNVFRIFDFSGTPTPNRWRRYRVELDRANFREVSVTTADTVQAPSTAIRPYLLVMDNSYSFGSGTTLSTAFETSLWEVCRLLNLEPYFFAKPSSGFTVDGTGSPGTYLARLTSDVLTRGITNIALVYMGNNNNDVNVATTAAFTAALNATLVAFKNAIGAPIFGMGTPITVQHPITDPNSILLNNASKAGYVNYGAFGDMYTQSIYNKAGALTYSGGAPLLNVNTTARNINADTIHPTTQGALLEAQFLFEIACQGLGIQVSPV